MEFRIYNRPRCNLFDLIGYKERNQTKGLGFLLANSKVAMEAFLSLIFPKTTVQNYLKLDWVVDCEFSIGSTIKSKKIDILVRFFKNGILEKTIIIEAKSLRGTINNKAALSQISAYKSLYASSAKLNPKDIILVTLTTYVSIQKASVQSLSWQDLINRFYACIGGLNNPTKNQSDLLLIQDYLNYINKIQGIMNYYDKEVLVIPATKTIKALKDPQCGIYECPVKTGQFNTRAQSHPLYIAFKESGKIDTLYKLKEIVQIDITDQVAIDSLNEVVENGIRRYPEFKKKIDKYKTYNPGVKGNKWIFIIDFDNSIDLYYPVLIPSGARGNEYRSLKEIFNSPAVEDNGRIVLKLPLKNGNSTKKSRSVKNNTLNTSQV